jgi:NAD+ dependent glucose-6-phosphate dehydrogenase
VARPVNFYGYTKVAGESLGRYYHDRYGMSVICIRFGAVTERDVPASPAQAAVYMSKRDAAQAVERTVKASPEIGFEAFYALSDNAARFRDLERAYQLIGFRPQDGIIDWPVPGSEGRAHLL